MNRTTAQPQRLMITGGAGFIGSALIRQLLSETHCQILNYDALTYAGNLNSLIPFSAHPNYTFVHADICERSQVAATLATFRPDALLHLAAESHVDRSIEGPAPFVRTNVVGMATLLEECTRYWRRLPAQEQAAFRFLHVSTDEVYGTLGHRGLFSENTPYDPRSPYAASKAAADHLARAWVNTYGLPALITNCSNNYGPYQFPEKLIPLTILNALSLQPIPLYGDGTHVRDWLHVDDHACALRVVLARGRVGQTYNIGGRNERTNVELVTLICHVLDQLKPRADGQAYAALIHFVADRPGHDFRYAIDTHKITTELGWHPTLDFATGLKQTIQWYLANAWWWQPLRLNQVRNVR